MSTRPAMVPGLLAANLLLLSFVDFGRQEFTLFVQLGLIACCVWLASVALKLHQAVWLAVFIPIALLWNPVLAVQLPPHDTLVAHVLAGLGVMLAAFLLHRHRQLSAER